MTTARDGDVDAVESMRDRVVRIADAVPLPTGVVTGVATAFAGYLAYFGLLTATSAVDFSRSTGTVLRSVGDSYYSAHNVPTYERQVTELQVGEVAGERTIETWTNTITGWQRTHGEVRAGGRIVDEETVTDVLDVEPTLPREVYLIVPVVLLLGAGVVLSRRILEPPTAGLDAGITGLFAGGSITLGYLLVVLTGTYALERTAGRTVFRPAQLEALGYGLAYPLVFGTAGAVLGMYWQQRRAADETETASV